MPSQRLAPEAGQDGLRRRNLTSSARAGGNRRAEKDLRTTVSQEAAVASQAANPSPVGRLAQFFPGATPVRMPVRVTGVSLRGRSVSEQSVVEFATAQEVL